MRRRKGMALAPASTPRFFRRVRPRCVQNRQTSFGRLGAIIGDEQFGKAVPAELAGTGDGRCFMAAMVVRAPLEDATTFVKAHGGERVPGDVLFEGQHGGRFFSSGQRTCVWCREVMFLDTMLIFKK